MRRVKTGQKIAVHDPFKYNETEQDGQIITLQSLDLYAGALVHIYSFVYYFILNLSLRLEYHYLRSTSVNYIHRIYKEIFGFWKA